MKNYAYVFVYNETDIQTINMHLKWKKYPYNPQWCSLVILGTSNILIY